MKGNHFAEHLGDQVRDLMMAVLLHPEILPAGYRLIKIEMSHQEEGAPLLEINKKK